MDDDGWWMYYWFGIDLGWMGDGQVKRGTLMFLRLAAMFGGGAPGRSRYWKK